MQQGRPYPPSPATPTGPSTSSSSNTRNNKLDHIVQNFYTKTAQVIVQSRLNLDLDMYSSRGRDNRGSTGSRESGRKPNKWFNLTTQDVDFLRDELRYWRSLAIQSVDEEPPPLYLDIWLDTSQLSQNQILVLADDHLQLNPVDTGYPVASILIERWVLTLNHPLPDFPVDLPNVYKRSIVFFRSLYSFVRLLPGHKLHRRLRVYGQTNGLSLRHRMSTSPIYHEHEVSLDSSVLGRDSQKVKTYEFSEIVTPLGTFRLQVQYRENCDFRIEDSEQDLSARIIDMDEDFFTPTMEAAQYSRQPFYHQGPSTDTQETVSQQTQQSSSRRSSFALRSSPQSASPFGRESPVGRVHTPVEASTPPLSVPRRISAPHVSPFKSPSLSSSPQAELMFGTPRQQPTPTDRTRPPSQESGPSSSRGRIEFSSSFDKIMEKSGSPSRTSHTDTSMTRRWSRASDNSSIHLEPEEAELKEFVRSAAAKPELKMFQNRATASQMAESASLSPTSETSSSLGTSGYGSGSIYRSKKALSHFRALRETHYSLSESLSSSIMAAGASDRQEPPSPVVGTSLGSSTSSTSRYLPVVPSPLHVEHSSSAPVHIPRSHHRSSEPVLSRETPQRQVQHRRHHSSQHTLHGTSEDKSAVAFSSYPKDRHHDELRRLQVMDAQDRYAIDTYTASDGNRHRYSMSDTDATGLHGDHEPGVVGQGSAQGGRASSMDDDDSLVFKMSELDTQESLVSSSGPARSEDPLSNHASLQRPLTEAAFNTRDYARRLGINMDISPRQNSSNSTAPSNAAAMVTVVEEEEKEHERAREREQ